jgi:hypothetical protein
LISIKVLIFETEGGAVGMPRKKMDEFDVPIDEIKAEIRESIDRAKALVLESERYALEHPIHPPEPKPN